jgi:hypothetical protein
MHTFYVLLKMARISSKNPRFRTKEEICHDLSYILLDSHLHTGTKLAVVDQIFWVWTEFEGKYKGCNFWSKEAISSNLKDKGLVHEHLVPRKIVREQLLALPDKNPDAIRSFLDNILIGVVVTKGEDDELNKLGLRSIMPSDWDDKDVWARHKAAGIIPVSQNQ